MGFFCENCGREVKRNSDSCPGCGVSFKAVKCPSCGFTDKSDSFKGGCPSCGYMGKDEKYSYIDISPGKKDKRPILEFIPASLFWASGFVLIILLLLLFRIFLK